MPSWGKTAFVDGGIDVSAAPVGVPQFSSPIPLSTTKYVMTEEWQGPFTTPALPLNTPHWSVGLNPDYSAYILVEESDRRDLGGGQVRWTRRYALVPQSYSLPQPFPYSFIGFFGSWGQNVQIPQGRNRDLLTVESRVAFDFFLVDPVNGDNVNTFTSQWKIPIITAQKYRLVAPYGTTWWTDIDWLSDAPPFTIATTPSRTTYNGWQANASKYGWSSGQVVYKWGVASDNVTPTFDASGTQANPGQICAEDSQIDIWMGNIFVRKTRFVLAQ
jgi:hypothetical protein